MAAWADVGAPNDTRMSFWTTPIDEIGDAIEPDWQVESVNEGPTHVFVSATHYAYRTTIGRLVLRNLAHEATQMTTRDFRGIPQNEHLRDGRLIFEMWNGGVRLATGTRIDGPSILLDVVPWDIQQFQSDGASIAWIKGRDWDGSRLRFAEVELWTAPYPEPPSSFAPRRVTAWLDGGAALATMGGHYYAMQVEDYEMDVYDLRDGTRRHWVPPDGASMVDPPLYVTDDEILAGTNAGAYRIDPNTLPVVP